MILPMHLASQFRVSCWHLFVQKSSKLDCRQVMFRFGQDIAASLKSNTAITDLDLSGKRFLATMGLRPGPCQAPDRPMRGPPHLAGPPFFCNRQPHISSEHVKTWNLKMSLFSLTLKIRGHGCQCSQSGSKMKRLEVFSLSLWFQKHFNCKLVATVASSCFTICCSSQVQKSRVREDVTWPTSVGLSWSMWAACPGSLVIVDRQVLAEALKENRTLKRLNLADNRLGIRGVEVFADRLGRRMVQFWYSSLIAVAWGEDWGDDESYIGNCYCWVLLILWLFLLGFMDNSTFALCKCFVPPLYPSAASPYQFMGCVASPQHVVAWFLEVFLFQTESCWIAFHIVFGWGRFTKLSRWRRSEVVPKSLMFLKKCGLPQGTREKSRDQHKPRTLGAGRV